VAGLILILVLFAVAYAVFLRPQRRRQTAHRELLMGLEPGDEIVSTGGLYGVVKSVDGDDLRVEIADGLVVRMARRAVAGIVAAEIGPGEAPESPERGAESGNAG
jgi:preprotein translocase subunit YajC